MNKVRCAGCQCQTAVTFAPTLRTRIYHARWCALEPAISQHEDRDDTIVALLDLGRTQRRVSELFGVSKARVQEIARARRLAVDIEVTLD